MCEIILTHAADIALYGIKEQKMIEMLLSLIEKLLPFETMQYGFMQKALLGLILLAPITSSIGISVVNLKMAFFSDAISHCVFAGMALGFIFGISPSITTVLFSLFVGLSITALQNRGGLSTDTVIGVIFSASIAFGLAIVSRTTGITRELQGFIFGDILTIDNNELMVLFVLLGIVILFQCFLYNGLLYISLNPVLAQVHGIPVKVLSYIYSGLLSIVVILALKAVGVLLVTALLVIPAASARNISRSARGAFWWAQLFGILSSFLGLIISAQDWAQTATGATIVLVASCFFLLTLPLATKKKA